MAISVAVLVLGFEKRRAWVAQLEDMGFIPLVRDSTEEGVALLRRHSVAAVCIDGQCEHLDALECILNIRDIEEHLPIFVLDLPSATGLKQAIAQLQDVYLLDADRRWTDSLPAALQGGFPDADLVGNTGDYSSEVQEDWPDGAKAI